LSFEAADEQKRRSARGSAPPPHRRKFKMSNIKCNIATIAAITITLCLPAISLAQAQEGSEQTRATALSFNKHPARYKSLYNVVREPSTRPGYASPIDTDSLCKTAPSFCPDYHGSNGG
jgi:hypothetical protein